MPAHEPTGLSISNAKSSRYRELDALRGLAAAAVVLYHYTVRFFELFPGDAPLLQFNHGGLGVEVFFGISGFVILMTLERSKTASDFLVSRFSRLYPAYWACLILTYTAMLVWPLEGRTVGPMHALANLSMWQEILGMPHVDGVYWSLQIELIFYALILLVYLAGWLRHVKSLLMLWLVVALLVVSLAHGMNRPVPYFALRLLLLEYSPFFAIGACAYLAFKQSRIDRGNWSIFALAVVVAGVFHGTAAAVVSVGMVVLFALIALHKASALDQPAFVYLGTISYSLYLLHQNIGYAIMRAVQKGGGPAVVAIGAAIVISLSAATVVTFAVERPSLKWIRDRLRTA